MIYLLVLLLYELKKNKQIIGSYKPIFPHTHVFSYVYTHTSHPTISILHPRISNLHSTYRCFFTYCFRSIATSFLLLLFNCSIVTDIRHLHNYLSSLHNVYTTHWHFWWFWKSWNKTEFFKIDFYFWELTSPKFTYF